MKNSPGSFLQKQFPFPLGLFPYFHLGLMVGLSDNAVKYRGARRHMALGVTARPPWPLRKKKRWACTASKHKPGLSGGNGSLGVMVFPRANSCCRLLFQARKLISDFAIILSILIFCGIDALVGVDTPKLIVPSEFKVRPCHLVWWLFPPICPV